MWPVQVLIWAVSSRSAPARKSVLRLEKCDLGLDYLPTRQGHVSVRKRQPCEQMDNRPLLPIGISMEATWSMSIIVSVGIDNVVQLHVGVLHPTGDLLE